MSTNIMATAPAAPGRPTRGGGKHLSLICRALEDSLPRDLALAAGEAESPVDDRRAEAPLGDQHPPSGNKGPPQCSPSPPDSAVGATDEGRVCSDEGGERDGDPGPAALDEQGVEDVVLAREVAGRLGCEVGVARSVVRRGAGLWAQERE